MKFKKGDLIQASFIKLSELKIPQDKKDVLGDFILEAQDTDLKMFILGKNTSVLTESATVEDLDKLFEDHINSYEENNKVFIQELSPETKTSLKNLGKASKIVAANAAVMGGIGYLANKYGKCIKHCDPNYVRNMALFGAATSGGMIAPLIVKLIGGLYRKTCIAKCKVQYYTKIEKNPEKKLKWENKLRDIEAKVKIITKNLRDKGKIEKANKIELAFKKGLQVQAY